MANREKLSIIKIGGNVLDHASNLEAFLGLFARVEGKKILVHGGGKIATRIGEKLGIKAQYVDGRRITDDETLDLVTMVYGGLINKKIAAQLQALGCNAIGLTGADANLVPATKRPLKNGIDYGWAGDVIAGNINTGLLHTLLANQMVPVFAPLTHDGQGHMLNTNADTIASAVAVALSSHFAVRLLYCFEKRGVLENVDNDDSVIPEINSSNFESLRAEGRLFAGILPKIENAFAAVNAGVDMVLIGHANDVLQNTGTMHLGTKIKR
jgi:acetylglutamate kinase